MAQAYFPSTGQTAFPLSAKESPFEGLSASEKLLKVEDVQEAYIEHKDRCVSYHFDSDPD
jgi:mitofusin